MQNDQIIEYSDDQIQKRIKKIWVDYQQKYPDSYDGKLILMREFEHTEDLTGDNSFLLFNVSIVHYSTIIGLKNLQIPIQNYGFIGTQIAIFNDARTHVLVGKRRYNQDYAPGILTFPGGILEVNDITNPAISLLRELNEEIDIKIKQVQCSALLAEHTGYSLILLITGIIDQPFNSHEKIKEKENEFAENELFWLELEKLRELDDKELMEGLSFLKRTV